MKDYEDNDLKPVDLELRLQYILNKMFICLNEVLKDYGYNDLGFK